MQKFNMAQDNMKLLSTGRKNEAQVSKQVPRAGVAQLAAPHNSTVNVATGFQVAMRMQNTSNNHSNKLSASSKPANNNNASKPAGENTGRWTPEEHNTFLAGLEQHGKEWKKIASMIETRTVVQIRTHAQKYFQKIRKTAEQEGRKDIPSDLTSTASNPRQKCKSKSTKSKRQTTSNGNRTSNKVERYNTVGFAATSKVANNQLLSSQQIKRTATQGKNSLYPGLTKTQRINSSDKFPHGTVSVEASHKRPALDSDLPQKKLKISTAKIEEAKLNDLKWFLAHNQDMRLPDASPTSVADIGLFRFGGAAPAGSSFQGPETDAVASCDADSLSCIGAAPEFLSDLDYTDEYPGSDNPEECVLSSLSCESDSMVSEWLSADEAIDAAVTKVDDTPSKYVTMDFHTLMEPLPELSLCSLSEWVASSEPNSTPSATRHQVQSRVRTASLDSISMLSGTA